MRSINLKLCDVNWDSIGNVITYLREEYDVKLDGENPDFILHSCYGREALKYDGVRILWLGENLQPDFNISDYAMGFGRMQFGERYRRIPLYRWWNPEYDSLFNQDRKCIRVDGRECLADKKRFCTLVVSNSGRGAYFEAVFERLNQYKKIDSGGRWRNNIGGPVANKNGFLASGKFTLAFENSSTPGYVTEKIMHGFAAHTIPIYWGAPDVTQDFNPKAFINCHDFNDIEALVQRVIELDQDDNAYRVMIEQPCFADGKEPEALSKNEIKKWFKVIFDQPREAAYRRNLRYWGAKYERDLYRACFQPHLQTLRMLKHFLRKR